MNKIAIIGCGGSGKTHLANQLAALVNLPLTHLDGVYYDADWNPLPPEEFAARQRDLVAQPRWLIEGNYAGTLPIRLAAADTVIFLDLHALICLAGIAQRRWHYRGGQHAQDGVYDRITWNFVRIHLGIPQEHAPPGPATPGRARWQRPVGHPDQPPSGSPIPGSSPDGGLDPYLTGPRKGGDLSMPATPFTDHDLVAGLLYATAGRLAQRTGVLHAAKRRRLHPAVTRSPARRAVPHLGRPGDQRFRDTAP